MIFNLRVTNWNDSISSWAKFEKISIERKLFWKKRWDNSSHLQNDIIYLNQSFPITCELGQLKFRRHFFKNNIPLWNESW